MAAMSETGDVYWRAVAALGRLGGGDVPASIADLDPQLLHDAVVESKVVRLAVKRLGGQDTLLAKLLRATDAAERQRHQDTAALTDAVVEAAARHGLRVIKGLAMRVRYPRPESRHAGDVDLHAGDWASALAFVMEMRAAGWPWDVLEVPWLKWDEYGVVYGQLALLRFSGGPVPVPHARIDVHIGAFSVGHAGRMPLVGWEPARVRGTEVLVPNRESAIALTVAHALGDTRLSLKDLNDLHVLVDDGKREVDWSSVIELCRCADALGVLAQLLAELATIYDTPGLPRLGRTQPVLAPGGLAPHWRGEHFARHAQAGELARGASAHEAQSVAQDARRYFSTDLRPRVSAGDVSLPVGRGACWRLLPQQVWQALGGDDREEGQPVQERHLADGLVLRECGQARIVLIGGEVFVPTVWGDVGADSLALAARAARS
jgi:hypothetical protein